MTNQEYITLFCTGCGLCHSVLGVELKADDKGFIVPIIKEDSELEFFKNTCPVFYYSEEARHDIWGNVEKAYVGYSSNEEIRYKAASGGALTELCIFLLDNNLVDGILHTTFDPKDHTKTVSVISTNRDDVIARCGSRYSISVPLENIIQNIDINKQYAFVGKPCDVMALKNYINDHLDLKNSIIYLLSFFCAGEPSVNAQDNLLARMNCDHNECKSITYRGNGWPGYTTVVKENGQVEKLEYNVTWGQYLGRDLRNICRFCMDGTGDAADIVCADFWYLDGNGKPDFSEHEGRNIIISRNDKGTTLLSNLIKSGNVIMQMDFTSNMNEFHKYQPAQYKRKGTMRSMLSAMKLCGRVIPKYSNSYLKLYASHLASEVKLRYYFGIIKRVLKKRL